MMSTDFKNEYIKLRKIEIKNNRVDYFIDVSNRLKQFFNNKLHMFIEYDINIEDVPKSILIIPFVANVMPLVWLTNSTLWIDEIDREYYDSLFRIRLAYQDMYQNYKFKGNIISAKTIYNTYKIRKSACQLFSGGLDAMATCIRIKDEKPTLINIYGWYENCIVPNKVFDSDKKNISEFAQKYSLETEFIKSNFATFILADKVDKIYKKKLKDSWWHGLQHGMCFIGHAIPIAYKYGIANIYIASSFSLGGVRHTCSSDPAVDIQVKYASGGVVHDGFELIRQDKIKLVVQEQQNIKKMYPLRVCSFNDKNCCVCEKCFRTILGLVAEGADIDKFGFVINDNLKMHFNNLMNKKIQFLGIERESDIHWPDIKIRILENMDNIREREFIEWFLNYDFIKKRKIAVLKYRVKNFIPIIKRKILRG